MNSTEIFALALGLKEPWIISNVEILTSDDSVNELHIHFGFKRGNPSSQLKPSVSTCCPIICRPLV